MPTYIINKTTVTALKIDADDPQKAQEDVKAGQGEIIGYNESYVSRTQKAAPAVRPVVAPVGS